MMAYGSLMITNVCDPHLVSFTLDTNCIIDLAEGRPGAAAIRALADAHASGRADVALVAVSASERQPGDSFLDNYTAFEARVASLGLGHLGVLPTIAHWNLGFWGIGIWATPAMADRERLIHEALFPSIPYAWPEFAAAQGISVDTVNVPEAKRWRNAFCDRQMFWAHDHDSRDVFVTSDENFAKRLGQSAHFCGARIAKPETAMSILR
jgi:hypothetical protein